MQLVSIPFGTAGSFSVQEAAGVITATVAYTDPNTGCQANASLVGPIPGVLTFIASKVTNATGKMILTDLAAAAKLAP